MRKRSAAPPSSEFQGAFTYAGSIVVVCDFCGRTHFANSANAGDWEDGELERLREQEREDPSKVMGWDADSIGRGVIEGREFAECCPCREIRRYEDFIWDHRYEILTYIQERSRRNIERAKAEAEDLVVTNELMDRYHVTLKLQEAIREAKAIEGEPGDTCIEAPPTPNAMDGEIQMCGSDGHGWRFDVQPHKWTHLYGLERA